MNFNELTDLILKFSAMGISPLRMCMNLLVALVISLVIFVIYRLTYSGVVYAKSFNVSLIIMALVTSMAMMMIRSNLALSLGTLGTLSIIRFRNAIKEPKDIAYTFWTIIVGLCAGTGAYALAIVGSVVISIVLLISSNSKSEDLTYLLVVRGNKFDNDKVVEIIKKHTKRFKVRTKNFDEKKTELMYEVFLKNKSEAILIDSLKEEGASSVSIVAYNNDIGR